MHDVANSWSPLAVLRGDVMHTNISNVSVSANVARRALCSRLSVWVGGVEKLSPERTDQPASNGYRSSYGVLLRPAWTVTFPPISSDIDSNRWFYISAPSVIAPNALVNGVTSLNGFFVGSYTIGVPTVQGNPHQSVAPPYANLCAFSPDGKYGYLAAATGDRGGSATPYDAKHVFCIDGVYTDAGPLIPGDSPVLHSPIFLNRISYTKPQP